MIDLLADLPDACRLPAPYFQRDGITLYHGDCREILPLLTGVDSLISDPPYGIGYQHGGGRRATGSFTGDNVSANGARHGCRKIVGDDAPFDPSFLCGFPRVLIWGADRYAPRLPDGGSFLCWDKSIGIGPADSFCDAEFAWCNWKEKRQVFRMLWKGMFCDKVGENNGLRSHPTQKPNRLMRWCITLAGGTGLICDPFAGSGTTLRAAMDLGRRAIGIEIDEKHCEIAAKRLMQRNLQFR